VLTLALLVGSLGSLSAVPLRDTIQPDTSHVAAVADDTLPRRRRKAVEYSEWYNRRLTIHRWSSYTMLPLFAGNYITGQQLLSKGNQAPTWAIDTHGPLATGVTALFTINTITGLWNLWDGRADPAARGWRVAHALLMLGGDAGFTTAGILSSQAKRSYDKRLLHERIALVSIGASTLGYVMMLKPFRRD
jgi:hypothetical protein